MARRGRASKQSSPYEVGHADFMKVTPGKTALVIVDVQNGFVAPESRWYSPEPYKKSIPKIKRLIAACRGVRIPIIYVREAFHPSGGDMGLSCKMFPSTRELLEGTRSAEIIQEIAPRPGDIVLTKKRYSGFYETGLDMLLRTIGIDTLIVCGTQTNVCVGHTVRDAFIRNYNVIVGSDITWTDREDMHEYELKNFRYCYARVITFDEIMRELEGIKPLAKAVSRK